MMTVDVRARVEPELKREAMELLSGMGLDMSTAFRLFLRSVVEKGGMPMDFPRPNATTMAAINEARQNKLTPVTLSEL